MPENKPTPTTETKKPDAATKAPDVTKPIEPKAPIPVEKKPNDSPKEPPKAPMVPPATPPTPPQKEPPKDVPKQPEEKGKSITEPKQAEAPKSPADAKMSTEAEKTGEKKPAEKETALPPKAATLTEPKAQAAKKPEEKAPATDPKSKASTEPKKPNEKAAPGDANKGASTAPSKKSEPVPPAADKKGQPATDPKKPEDKSPTTDTKSKSVDAPKKEAPQAPITANGGAKVEKPKEPVKPVSTGKPTAEPAKGPPKSDVKTPPAAPKDKTTDAPKKDAAPPLKVAGKDKVEIPTSPKPAEKSEPSTAPKVTQPAPLVKETTSPQGEPKVKEAAAPTQAAEGPKGIVISQVFDDRLAPPSAADLKSLPTPKEGEAFSMRLHPAYFFEFLEHPFTINRETKDYKDLYESIKENGIHDPVYCRPRKDGGLEIMSGHRRHDIGTQLNYPIPTIIVQADDDTARIAVVDGNLHRLDIPTSELARAAKMKMEALTRKAGRRSKMDQLTAPQKRSDQQVAEDMGMSRNQVQRLVRIDSLVPELKQQVDEKKLPFNTAVELSYMKPDEQKKVVDYMEKEQITPSMSQATQLKEASKHAETLAKHMPTLAPANQVNEEKIASIIKPKKEPELKVTLTADELRSYFPGKLPTVPEAKRVIFDALDLRKKALEKQAKKQDIKPPAR